MNRPRFQETIRYRLIASQDFSSRRRSFWALSTSLMAGNSVNEPPVAQRTRTAHPAVREIHKNAWLKRQTSIEKKGTPFSKKGEKLWVVFCVHDDVEAFLEFYSEPKMGTIHKPLSAISLNTCLHVSPSIMGQDNEYQFAVTLQNDVIRLTAANWEQMIEWVESLQGKLREMNILSPKDNLYSKLPETKLAPGLVGSTRDPNSPLPPTPSTLVALATSRSNTQNARSDQGQQRPLEPIPAARGMAESNSSAPSLPSRMSGNGNTSTPDQFMPGRESERNSQPLIELHNSDSRAPTVSHQQPTSSASIVLEHNQGDSPAQGNQPKRAVKVNVDIRNIRRTSSNGAMQHQQQRHHSNSPSPSASSTSASTTVVVIGNNDARIQNNQVDLVSYRNACGSTMSVTITGMPITSEQAPSETSSTESTQQIERISRQTQEECAVSSLGDPSVSPSPCATTVPVNYPKFQRNQATPRGTQRSATENGAGISADTKISDNSFNANPFSTTVRSTSTENIYEHIYIPERLTERSITKQSVSNGNHKVRSHVHDDVDGTGSHRSSNRRSPDEEIITHESHARRVINKSANGGSNQRSSSLGRIEIPPGSSRPDHQRDEHSRRNCNRNRQGAELARGVGNSTFFVNNGSPAQLQGNPIDCLIGSRSGEYRLRRDEYLIRMGAGDATENDNQSADISHSNDPANGTHVPLKEQQVIHLQREINHPGGVRIILRKRDCLNSMAFVDYLGAVWISGWKQTQFPVLYYAFHVGDQILKVAGVTVQSSVEASRVIKMVSTLQVEFIIRRLPYGKVFALKRSRDGEPLGLVAEGGSGEISEVLPDGLAARYGLPPKGLSVDGHTPCNWYLTEVNNRPLSLMSKENEVKDRLNAVGKEISILVQPADLVKHLRKNLKSFKGFKEYVVG